ncbi:thioesterase family protein [Saccharopolyspora sp. K220]|uniref:acyl-CoA thioesterase n=1 Tax=Saccharopolyspora soli TaxID=2926618 RepID=UPI001F5636AF|nr:thioesterase family protein [Saccharopolyspora soli]MCI2422973.1 thioesterase family protein [Saccharopolyspora soli]
MLLDVRIRYLNELRLGDEVTISVEPAYGTGKTWTVEHLFAHANGEPVARMDAVLGLIDYATRRLNPEPLQAMRSLAARPDLL